DLMRFLRQPSRLVGALGQPVIFWGVIGSGMAATFRMPGSPVGYLEYFFPGVILMVVVFASIFATVSVIEDRHAGFLLPVLVAPGSRGAMVFGRCLGAATVSLLQAALFVLLAPWAGFSLARVDWPLLAGSLALVSLGLTALGFAVAWALDNLAGFHAIQMTLLVPLWVISGAMFPAAPGSAFAAAMRWNPLSYAVSAARSALYGGAVPAGLARMQPAGDLVSLLVLCGFTVACLGAAVIVCVKKR
ncbi:MAG TPA: ABC transporter permease, partial [Myxococcales bacterium]|nr:ABC transporter permease [Myxococcales bacterium]